MSERVERNTIAAHSTRQMTHRPHTTTRVPGTSQSITRQFPSLVLYIPLNADMGITVTHLSADLPTLATIIKLQHKRASQRSQRFAQAITMESIGCIPEAQLWFSMNPAGSFIYKRSGENISHINSPVSFSCYVVKPYYPPALSMLILLIKSFQYFVQRCATHLHIR